MPIVKPSTVARTMPMRGDQKRVEKADPEGTAECRGTGGIVDQRLADVEAGGVVPEAESRGDMGIGEVLRRVMNRGIGNAADDDDEPDLQRNVSRPAHASATKTAAVERTAASAGPRQPRPVSETGSADRQAVLQAALGPQRIEPARNLQRRALTDVTLEAFAVIADRLDDVVGPIVAQPERLAELALDA